MAAACHALQNHRRSARQIALWQLDVHIACAMPLMGEYRVISTGPEKFEQDLGNFKLIGVA
jgi:hypothetical protein